jgi:hypothetical protein
MARPIVRGMRQQDPAGRLPGAVPRGPGRRRKHEPFGSVPLVPMPLASLWHGSNVEVDGWSEAPHRQEVWT